MSCRQSKKQIRSYIPEYSRALATSNAVRSATPASAARSRAVSIDGPWKSNPMIFELGYASAMTITEAPCPQPISATRAPLMSRSCTPSSAGIHSPVR